MLLKRFLLHQTRHLSVSSTITSERDTGWMDIPARVRFPLRVKLVLRAPVPAYILDNASPFSAHNSRWYDHSEFEVNHQSFRARRRYCSKLVLDKMSCTKFVRSRLIPKYISPRGVREQTIECRFHTSQDSSYGRFLSAR